MAHLCLVCLLPLLGKEKFAIVHHFVGQQTGELHYPAGKSMQIVASSAEWNNSLIKTQENITGLNSN